MSFWAGLIALTRAIAVWMIPKDYWSSAVFGLCMVGCLMFWAFNKIEDRS